MIYSPCNYDIISVPSYAKHISSAAGGYHIEDISPVPTRNGYHWKKSCSFEQDFFLAPQVGLEPTPHTVRNIVVLLAWSASQYSLFLPARQSCFLSSCEHKTASQLTAECICRNTKSLVWVKFKCQKEKPLIWAVFLFGSFELNDTNQICLKTRFS